MTCFLCNRLSVTLKGLPAVNLALFHYIQMETAFNFLLSLLSALYVASTTCLTTDYKFHMKNLPVSIQTESENQTSN